MIVDTGATHHVIAKWLAAELAVPVTTAGDKGTDHTGKKVAVSRLDQVSFSLSGWGPVSAPTLLVVAVPDALKKLGIGGFLSPQALALSGRAVLLDFRAGSMFEAPIDEALQRLAIAPGGPPPTALRVCDHGPNGGQEFVAQTTIEGIAAEVKI